MYEELITWVEKRLELIGIMITTSRFNELLNDTDLGFYSGAGPVIKEISASTNIGMVAVMAGCKASGMTLSRQDIVEILQEANIECKVTED